MTTYTEFDRRRTARIRAAVRAEKVRRGCARCGLRPANPAGLEWDHTCPRVLRAAGPSPATANSWAKARRWVSNPDVQVLCTWCHHEKTKNENYMLMVWEMEVS